MLLNKFDTPLEDCNLKFDSDGLKDGTFTGYASVFGGVDSYGDTIVKGAFADTIKNRKRPVRMFFGHSPGRVIGKWLDLREDDHGLHVKGELTPGNDDSRNVYALMKHGAIDGLSIGFREVPGGSEDSENGGKILKKVNLVEISVVSMPADDFATVSSVKSLADEIADIQSIKDAELFLREAGSFPRSMAKAYISQLKAVYLREAGEDEKRIEAIKEGREWLDHLVSTVINTRLEQLP